MLSKQVSGRNGKEDDGVCEVTHAPPLGGAPPKGDLILLTVYPGFKPPSGGRLCFSMAGGL